MGESPGAGAGDQQAPFAVRLRRARETAGLTQEELAERAGLTPNAVGALERGEHRHPYPATIRALAKALGLTEEERAVLAASVPKRGQAPVEKAAPMTGLPAMLSPLIGRESEIAVVAALLSRDDTRLVTLTGPGGTGKTSLAIEVAAGLRETFADGTAFVALAGLRDPGLVASTIAHALGVADTGGRTLVERMAEVIGDRQLLLVLDNFEHLLSAAPIVTDLLTRCPRLVVLATSRAALRLAGEYDVPVSPLALPEPARMAETGYVAGFAAVQLFAERARAVDPAFSLSANATSVAAICHRLDGLPLAIELAAARSRLFPPAALLPRLARRLPLLTEGRRDAPNRHQTMRDAIGWSYDLLAPDQQALFRQLAVFAGDSTLEAAEYVSQESGVESREQNETPTPDSVLAGISTLVDQRLLHRIDRADGEPRFAMLETIREFAAEQLAASGGEARVCAAHTAWCLDLAEQAAPFWFTTEQVRWGNRLDAEHDNLQAALARAADAGGTDEGIRLAGRLWQFWFVRGHYTEGRAWLDKALTWGGGARTIERVRVLTGASAMVRMQGDEPLATTYGEEALEIVEAIGAGTGIDAAHVLIGHALAAGNRHDFELAIALNEQVLAILRGLGDADPSTVHLEGVILANQAGMAYGQGDDERAVRLAETSLAHHRRYGSAWGEPDSLYILGLVAHRRGDVAGAAALCRESLALAWAAHDPTRLVSLLDRLCLLAEASGEREKAARLLGAATSLYERLGMPPDPGGYAGAELTIAAIREGLGPTGYDAALAAGRALTLDDAIAEAMALAEAIAAGIVNPDRS